MNAKNIWNKVILVFIILCSLASVSYAAEIADGQALIENGNIPKAREDARKDAMRNFVENKLGVRVESTTLVVNNMLVRDNILAKSDGYVSVKRIVKEWQDGDVFFIRMELDADDQKIKTAPADLQAKLKALGDNTSRSGIQVAIVGTDEYDHLQDLAQLNQYFQSKIEEIGFKTIVNDDVIQYLSRAHVSGAYGDKLKLNTEVRRIARNTRSEENAIIRGELSTVKTEKLSNGMYKAITIASFELLGLDSNEVNTFNEYFTAIDVNANSAVRKAYDLATQKAAESLGQKALETVQNEYRGGVKTIKTIVRFAGITDRIGQRQAIVDGLNSIGCHIIRTAFSGDGRFTAFVECSSFSTSGELTDAIIKNVPGAAQGNVNEAELGSSKLDFTF